MCDPVTAIAVGSLALTAASTGAQMYQQQQRQEEQSNYNQKQYENTMTAYRYNDTVVNNKQIQERAAAGQKIFENNIKARQAESKALTSAGESGVAGLSVGSLLQDLAGQSGRYNNSVGLNYENSYYALEGERNNQWSSAASQVNQLKTPETPDYFGAGLKIANAGMSSYAFYKQYNN